MATFKKSSSVKNKKQVIVKKKILFNGLMNQAILTSMGGYASMFRAKLNRTRSIRQQKVISIITYMQPITDTGFG
jgi:hypothetical protein